MKSLTWITLICIATLVSAQISDYFGEGDLAALNNLLSAPKGPGFGTLENTYDAVLAAKGLNGKISKVELCKYTSGALAEAKTIEEVAYATSSLAALDCSERASAKVDELVTKGLKSNDLYDLYHAVSALQALQKKGTSVKSDALAGVVEKLGELVGAGGEFLRTASGSDSSVYNAGLAFSTAAIAASLHSDVSKAAVSKVANEVETLLKDFFKAKAKTLSFQDEQQSALETTALITSAGLQLAKYLDRQLGFSVAHIEKITEFFIQHKTPHSLEQAHALALGLGALAGNHIHKPVAVTVSPHSIPINAKGSEGVVKVHVTDVFGKPVSAKVHLVRVSAGSRSDATTALLSNQDLVASAGAYEVNLLGAKPEKGAYTFDLKVTTDITLDNVLRTIKVLAPIEISDVELSVADSREEDAPATKYQFEVGKKYGKVIPAKQGEKGGQYLQLSFQAKNSVTGRPTTVHQAFLRFTRADGTETVFVAQSRGKEYRFVLDLASDASDFKSVSGKYRAEVQFGDAFATNAVSWKLADFDLSFKPVPSSAAVSGDLLSAKPAIEHRFRPADHRASTETSFLFTVATLAPLAIFLLGLPLLRANLGRLPFSGLDFIFAIGFIACLGAVLYTLVIYWLRLNMFQALGRLGSLALPTLFFGKQALRYLNAAPKSKAD